ncbi:MAG: potassium channel family protein [Pseudomonadota bacterium]
MSEYRSGIEKLIKNQEILVALLKLRKNEQVILAALETIEKRPSYAVVGELLWHSPAEFDIDGSYSMRFWIRLPYFDPSIPSAPVNIEFLDLVKDEKLVKSITNGPASPDIERQLVSDLVRSEDISSVKRAIESFMKQVQLRDSELLEQLDSIVDSELKWSLVDFTYFGTVTLTTLGYGDIIPNSTISRILVLLNSICGVFFVGFSLTVLTNKSA